MPDLPYPVVRTCERDQDDVGLVDGGRLRDGKPYEEHDAQGNLTYASIKGTFTWQRDVTPDYGWFDGTAGHYLLGDRVESSKPIAVNTLYGRYDEPDAKIVPVKVHRANQIYDPVTMMLVQPKLFAPNAGEGAFWKDFNWQTAAAAGMRSVGLPFSGRYTFVRTELTLPLNHMVAPKERALGCTQCHVREHSRLAGLSDVYLPGRDRNRVVDRHRLFRAAGGNRARDAAWHGARGRVVETEAAAMTTRTHVYSGFERFWHWTQAALILFLALSGFEVHGSFTFLGFDQAVHYHRLAADAFMVLIVFAVFWHLTTGEWRQDVPTTRLLRAQAEYYLVGVFRGAPHPTRRTPLSKLNPLQKLVYLSLKILVIPVMVVSGVLYMFYRYPQRYGIEALNVHGLRTIAVVHTAGAFCLVAFVVAHVYLDHHGPHAHLEPEGDDHGRRGARGRRVCPAIRQRSGYEHALYESIPGGCTARSAPAGHHLHHRARPRRERCLSQRADRGRPDHGASARRGERLLQPSHARRWWAAQDVARVRNRRRADWAGSCLAWSRTVWRSSPSGRPTSPRSAGSLRRSRAEHCSASAHSSAAAARAARP